MKLTSSETKPSGHADEILGVESTVKRTLKPVPPPPAFREHLRDGLVLAAQHQQTHHALEYARRKQDEWQWIWLAVAVTIGTGLGFIVMRLHFRTGPRA